MMVAVTISLIVVLGFAMTFVSMKQAFNSQGSLSVLQDNERLAMAMLTSSIEEAGYYSNCADPTATPIVQPSCTAMSELHQTTDLATPSGGSMANSLAIWGTAASAGVPETLSTAYGSLPGDGVLSCQGTTNPATSGQHLTWRNIFYVRSSDNTLGCEVIAVDATSGTVNASLSSAFTPLITNVSSMAVMYGVDTTSSGTMTNYIGPASMTVNNWPNVKTAQVTLVFIDPNAALTGSSGITWTQNINLMNFKYK